MSRVHSNHDDLKFTCNYIVEIEIKAESSLFQFSVSVANQLAINRLMFNRCDANVT